nr:hypothetical protein RVX_2269 [Nitratidesulfovibrio sp. HK-II]
MRRPHLPGIGLSLARRGGVFSPCPRCNAAPANAFFLAITGKCFYMFPLGTT